ncbi:hypothetical protein NPIL_349671 [Nephila pilipes]|uniref:Uncharacterized protein n=1 Tax=Nephila pilipes TaxID=299642 RepID=A0A8X6TZ84_NEPPI|nr:hypothetical protein NPIL_349671 [Nephila pilipes]
MSLTSSHVNYIFPVPVKKKLCFRIVSRQFFFSSSFNSNLIPCLKRRRDKERKRKSSVCDKRIYAQLSTKNL